MHSTFSAAPRSSAAAPQPPLPMAFVLLRSEALAAPADAPPAVTLPLNNVPQGLVLSVGRSQSAKVARLTGMDRIPRLSRYHAEVHRLLGGHIAIEDTHSTTGTFVDGERLEAGAPVFLKDGAVVTFAAPDAASAPLAFRYVADAQSPPAQRQHERPNGTKRKRGDGAELDPAVFTAVCAEELRKAECAICCELPVAAHGLGCGHIYCAGCIVPWIRGHSTCPTCRAVAGLPIPVPTVDRLVAALAVPAMSEEEQADRRRRAAEWAAQPEATRPHHLRAKKLLKSWARLRPAPQVPSVP